MEPWTWISNHLHLVGWPTLVYVAFMAGRSLTAVKDRAETAEAHIVKMATNDLPHIGESLNKINDNITGLRSDMKQR